MHLTLLTFVPLNSLNYLRCNFLGYYLVEDMNSSFSLISLPWFLSELSLNLKYLWQYLFIFIQLLILNRLLYIFCFLQYFIYIIFGLQIEHGLNLISLQLRDNLNTSIFESFMKFDIAMNFLHLNIEACESTPSFCFLSLKASSSILSSQYLNLQFL